MEQTHCAGCSTQFTFTTLKHVCRSCGDYFCHSCSSGKRPVPERGFKDAVRVCDLCLHAVDRRTRLMGQKKASNSINGHSNGDMSAAEEAAFREKEAHSEAMDRLKRIYKAKIRPLEQAYKFSEFYGSELTDGDFDARPFVLLVGGYSVGKTSFIKYMLGRDFPGSRIGPEPTTDRFLAIMRPKSEQTQTQEIVIPGNAAAVDVERPFTSLSHFGNNFLQRFELVELAAPILSSISFVDTPGILSGEKQRVDRGYSFESVVEWFAERADRILLLFDGNKLDISDELKKVIQCLKLYDDKIRIVLNKADLVDSQQLMRVYGALMWSLGKVIRSPEVLRVYISSFWDLPINEAGINNKQLFINEKKDLLDDLKSLPRYSAIRKINELVKRARLTRVHALLINHLRANMPFLWGHKRKQERLSLRLEEEYAKVQKQQNVAIGDFPNPTKFRAGLEAFDLSEFQSVSKRLLDVIEGALSRDIPKLMLDIGITAEKLSNLSQQQQQQEQQQQQPQLQQYQPMSQPTSPMPVEGNSPTLRPVQSLPPPKQDDLNPFHERSNGAPTSASNGGDAGPEWAITAAAKKKWDSIFQSLELTGSPPAVSGTAAREVMMQSGLPKSALRKVWDLADIDVNGLLDEEEFAIAMTLIRKARADGVSTIPESLPLEMIPPSRR